MVLGDDTLPDTPWIVESSETRHPTVSTPVLSWGAASCVGLRRRSNEDSYGHKGASFVVADGMGGRRGGAEAAERAVVLALKYGSVLGAGATLAEWRALVRIANNKVRAAMRSLGFTGAGCALTMATVETERVVAVHVGDTRLYELDRGSLCQRTNDHDLRSELTDLGSDLELAATQGLPLSGLTSYVGQRDANLRVDVFEWRPASGTRLLLCTDGVHRYVEMDAIAEVVSGRPPGEAALELTKRADAAGGRDNATAVVIEF